MRSRNRWIRSALGVRAGWVVAFGSFPGTRLRVGKPWAAAAGCVLGLSAAGWVAGCAQSWAVANAMTATMAEVKGRAVADLLSVYRNPVMIIGR
jgi:hypothetical protein